MDKCADSDADDSVSRRHRRSLPTEISARKIDADDSVDQSSSGKICHDDPDASCIPRRTNGSINESVCAFIVDVLYSKKGGMEAWEVWISILVIKGRICRGQAIRTCCRVPMTAYHKIRKWEASGEWVAAISTPAQIVNIFFVVVFWSIFVRIRKVLLNLLPLVI